MARRLYRYRGLRWMLGRSAGHGLLGDGPAWQGHLPLGVIAGNRPVGIGRLIGSLAGENDGTVTVAETRFGECQPGLYPGACDPHGAAVFPPLVCSFLKDGHFSLL